MTSIIISPDAAPVTPEEGEIYYDSTTGELYLRTDSNSTWISISGISGEIKAYAGSTEPVGWIFCDGTSYDGSQATYARLFAAIGTTYGGSGSTFNVPDMRGRVMVSPDNMGGSAASRITSNAAAVGATGGAETHTLQTSEMPDHTHTGGASGTQSISEGSHAHSFTLAHTGQGANGGGSGYETGGQYGSTTGSAGSWSKTIDFSNASISVANTGGGGAHANVQPYICVNHIIKL